MVNQSREKGLLVRQGRWHDPTLEVCGTELCRLLVAATTELYVPLSNDRTLKHILEFTVTPTGASVYTWKRRKK